MAKKYLLYIHDSRFENEQEKSALVNGLLEAHYGHLSHATKTIPKKAEVIEDALLSGKTVAEILPKLVEKPCKHGFPPKFCRFATAGKPCK